MREQQEYRTLTREELEELAGEPLPERAAMSLINANIAAPVNVKVPFELGVDRAAEPVTVEEPEGALPSSELGS